jgi:hypothetical protein
MKRLGVLLQKYRGLRAKPRDGVLILRKLTVFLTKLPHKGVSADLDRAITDQRLGLDSKQASAQRHERGLTGGTGESVT